MTHNVKIAYLTLLLVSSLLLASCGQQTASAPQTPAIPSVTAPSARVHGVYELQFRRDGQGKLVASSVRRLSGQALRVNDAPLEFSYGSSSTLNKDGKWYVRVTYRVSNPASTPQAIQNLALVPLDTDTIPGETPAATPTVGASYFKDVRHFDESDASDMASVLVSGSGARRQRQPGRWRDALRTGQHQRPQRESAQRPGVGCGRRVGQRLADQRHPESWGRGWRDLRYQDARDLR